MPRTFARLFVSFSILEDAFGLSELGTLERAVFRFIAERFADGQTVVTSDVVAAGITTRASVYRHLATLEDRDLICRGSDAGGPELCLHPRLARHREIIAEHVKAGTWSWPDKGKASNGTIRVRQTVERH